MIIFLEDWKANPTAVVHYKTANRSWVKMAGVLNAMGVKNCLFHLALLNPALLDVDPHSPSVTSSEITQILDECVNNPWYFLREVLRIPSPGSSVDIMVRANRMNLSAWFLFFNHCLTTIIAPRQTTKSGTVECLMTYLLTVGCMNTTITHLTKDDSLRVSHVAKLKELIATLPPYLQLRVTGDTNNTEKLTFKAVGNTYVTMVSQLSKKAALKTGRGITTPITHVEELAFVENLQITLPALLAAGSAARDSAASVGAPYGTIFTTTPGYLSSESGSYAHEIYNGCFRWDEKLLDSKNIEELHSRIKANAPCAALRAVLEYNHRQLGYTDDWLRGKISDAMASGISAEAEFLNIWPAGNSASIIPKDKLKIIIANRMNDSDMEISTYGYIVRWYIPKHKRANLHLIAGMDTSEAIGKDGIAMVLRDSKTGEVVGSGDFNETNTITFARWLSEFLIDNPNVTLMIERKNTAISIVDALIEILLHNNIDPFARIFNFVVNDSEVNSKYRDEVTSVPFRSRDKEVYIKYRKHFGYNTTGTGRTSRGQLYGETFSASLTYTADSIRDPKLITQLTGLRVKNNRIDHASGGHDDMVIAWLLGYWTLSKGSNLSFYGIPSNSILSTVAETKIEEAGGAEAVEYRDYQLGLKEDIDDLVEDIRNTLDPMRTTLLMAKLRHMSAELDSKIIQSFNVNALVTELELEKRNTKRWRR